MSLWISKDSSHKCMDIGGQFHGVYGYRMTVPMSVWISEDSSHECMDIGGQFH